MPVSNHIATIPSGSRDENCFDFLRLFAALCVLVQHSTLHLKIPFLWHRPGANDWFDDGVGLFFIISGMLVFRSAENCRDRGRPMRDYFANRFLRIAPALYVQVLVITTLLMAVGALSFGDLVSRDYLTWAAGTLALYPVYFRPTAEPIGALAVNGPLWTIPVEVSFYAVVPLIVLSYRRVGLLPTIATIWLVSMVAPVAFASMPRAYGLSFLPFSMLFSLGVVWAVCWPRAPQSPFLALSASACWLVVRYRLLGITDHLGALWGLAAALPLSYVAVWVAHHGPRLLSRLTAFIGDLSFGIYIWHSIVINLVLYIGGTAWAEAHVVSAHLVVFSSTLALAATSWRLIERPALRLKAYSSRERRTAEPMAVANNSPVTSRPAARPDSSRHPSTTRGAEQAARRRS